MKIITVSTLLLLSLMFNVVNAKGQDAMTASESSRYSGVRLVYMNGPVHVELSCKSRRPVGTSVTNTDALLVGGSYDAGLEKFFLGYQDSGRQLFSKALRIGSMGCHPIRCSMIPFYARKQAKGTLIV